jgi:hypothetical protein
VATNIHLDQNAIENLGKPSIFEEAHSEVMQSMYGGMPWRQFKKLMWNQ